MSAMEELLNVNQEIRIRLFDRLLIGDECPSQIIRIDPTTIGVDAPRRYGELVPLEIGGSLLITVAQEDAMYVLNARVVDYQREPEPIVVLSREDLSVKRIERRSRFRFKTGVLVRTKLAKGGGEEVKWAVDIGERGALLSDFLFGELDPGDQVHLKIYTSLAEEPVRALGEVVRIVEQAQGRCSIGVKFLSLENRDLLLRHMLELDQLKRGIRPDALIGETPQMQSLFETIERASRSDSTVFIQGESGTGKELVARAIHYGSSRKKKPFIPVNCGSIVESLLESELFGHVKGAFTGAVRDNPGLFKAAEKGTLFLDEVVEIPPAMQVKLLRALQEKEIRPVGSSEKRAIDVRLIAATNRDVEKAVLDGTLRRDFFYRLYVIPIVVPPLRERHEDIPLLVDHFLRTLKHKAGREVYGVSSEAMTLLWSYEWPGNVRELENVVESALALGKGELIMVEDLPPQLVKRVGPSHPSLPTLKQTEKELIKRTLEHFRGNKAKAARTLEIDRKTIYRKIREYSLEDAGRQKESERKDRESGVTNL